MLEMNDDDMSREKGSCERSHFSAGGRQVRAGQVPAREVAAGQEGHRHHGLRANERAPHPPQRACSRHQY